MKNLIGVAGVCVAVVGLAVAAFQDDLRPEVPEPSVQLKQRLLDSGARLLGADVETPGKHDVVSIAYMSLGLIALVLGVVAYLRKESHNIAGVAGALGVVTIAWEYVLLAIIIAVVIFILASLDIF